MRRRPSGKRSGWDLLGDDPPSGPAPPIDEIDVLADIDRRQDRPARAERSIARCPEGPRGLASDAPVFPSQTVNRQTGSDTAATNSAPAVQAAAMMLLARTFDVEGSDRRSPVTGVPERDRRPGFSA